MRATRTMNVNAGHRIRGYDDEANRGDAERGELPRDPEKPPVLTAAEGVVAPGPYQPHPDHHANRRPHCNVGIDGRAGRAQSGKKGRSFLRDAARSITAQTRERETCSKPSLLWTVNGT